MTFGGQIYFENQKKNLLKQILPCFMAESVGFEPTIERSPYT